MSGVGSGVGWEVERGIDAPIVVESRNGAGSVHWSSQVQEASGDQKFVARPARKELSTGSAHRIEHRIERPRQLRLRCHGKSAPQQQNPNPVDRDSSHAVRLPISGRAVEYVFVRTNCSGTHANRNVDSWMPAPFPGRGSAKMRPRRVRIRNSDCPTRQEDGESLVPSNRRDVAQPGRALGLGPRRRRFKSCRPDHLTKKPPAKTPGAEREDRGASLDSPLTERTRYFSGTVAIVCRIRLAIL